MSSLYWINRIMSTMYSNSSTPFFVGLSSTQPDSMGNNISEPSGGNYMRVRIASFTEPNNGMVSNSNELEFNRSSEIWFDDNNKATYWVVFDGSDSDAHMISYGLLDAPKCIDTNTVVKIAANSLTVTLSDYRV